MASRTDSTLPSRGPHSSAGGSRNVWGNEDIISAAHRCCGVNGTDQGPGAGGWNRQGGISGRQHPILTDSLSSPGVRLWSHFSPGTGRDRRWASGSTSCWVWRSCPTLCTFQKRALRAQGGAPRPPSVGKGPASPVLRQDLAPCGQMQDSAAKHPSWMPSCAPCQLRDLQPVPEPL